MLDPEYCECELLPVPPGLAERAAAEISCCEACNEDADIPFDWILADVMNRPGMFEFMLEVSIQAVRGLCQLAAQGVQSDSTDYYSGFQSIPPPLYR